MTKSDSATSAVPLGLAVRTSLEDVQAVCGYLLKKPTGATFKEMRAVVDAKHLEARKLNGLKRWGLVEGTERMRLLERGRRAAKDGGAHRAAALLEVVREIEPYRATAERAAHRGDYTVSAVDTAAHWHDNFRGQASGNDDMLNDQVLSFFQLAEGADLGRIIVGRRGQPTRFAFDEAAVTAFANGDVPADSSAKGSTELFANDNSGNATMAKVIDLAPTSSSPPTTVSPTVSRVFVTHGKNTKVLEQVKRLLNNVAKFEAVVAQERETGAKPVPEKVMDDMRSCQAAVIHVGSEGVWTDADGNPQPHINGNVLIEIGAAMALYNRRFILLVEEGVKLPSNLQGLYECRYKGDELSLDGGMKLVEALHTLR